LNNSPYLKEGAGSGL